MVVGLRPNGLSEAMHCIMVSDCYADSCSIILTGGVSGDQYVRGSDFGAVVIVSLRM